MATNPDDILGMSDEDISNLSSPPAATEPVAAGSDADPAGSDAGNDDDGLTDAERAAQADDGEDEDAGEPDAVAADTGADGADVVAAGADVPDPAKPAIEDLDDAAILAQAKPPAAADPAGDKKPEEAAAVEAPAGDKPGDKKEEAPAATAVEVTPEQASAFYKQIMAPLKADGRIIEIKSPEEVISLMQMGANYTRKLRDIQPHRKVLTMLQNNDLLDEGKLSFLIDLDKKDPAAIQKLVKESGIDPLDIDVAADPSYSPGGHQVSDEEMGFRTVMDDLKSNPKGVETLSTIHDTWDNASKEELWKDPTIMSAIHEQRESGVYDLITTEMDRQRTLGTLPANLSFIEAYKAVGNAMMAEVTAAEPEKPEAEPAGEVTPPVVVTRAAAPKRVLANGEKAAAASPTRSSPKAAKVIVNPLAMSDEEFERLPRV